MRIGDAKTYRSLLAKYRLISNFRNPLMHQVALVVTDRCNSKCIMCDIWKTTSREEFILDELEEILKNSDLPYITNFSLTGGEPFLREDLVDVARLIAKYHPDVSLVIPSNCLKTDIIVEKATEIARFAKVGVCISNDGLEKTHNTIRGNPDGFKRLIETVKELTKNRINISWSFTIMSKNYDQIERVYELSKEYTKHNTGDAINFCARPVSTGSFFKTGYEDKKGLALTETEKKVAIQQLEKVNEDLNISWLDYVIRFMETEQKPLRCGAGKFSCVITPDLRVFPCTHCPPSWEMGNLRESDYSLNRVLKSGKAKEVRKRVLQCQHCANEIEGPATMNYQIPLFDAIKVDLNTLVKRVVGK